MKRTTTQRIAPLAETASTLSIAPDSDQGGLSSLSTAPTHVEVDLLSRSLRERFSRSWSRNRSTSDADHANKNTLGLQLLRSSAEPLINLIFVHGLKGGSVGTWQKGKDPRTFWPQLWLPMEPGLRNANIYTFGYFSDWTTDKSGTLHIHDFGQMLLETLRTSPHLQHSETGPIILIGHSLGGLVVKKAYILSKDVTELNGRIRCIFFLATPHRGSDLASIIRNIVTISGVLSPRHYISDLSSESTSTQMINEDFGRLAHDISIFSFYETIRMGPGMIVEKQSAVLGPGFLNERAQCINANHRDICKFDSPDDPGYVTLKNSLVCAAQDIIQDILGPKMADSKEKTQILGSFLGVSDSSEENYAPADGSCQWLDYDNQFQNWLEPLGGGTGEHQPNRSTGMSIFWIYAKPGTGKTFLAAHVRDQLENCGLECASYFFHFGKRTSRSLSDFLRSIAFQMASTNASIREKLMSLVEDGVTFDKDDVRTMWNKIFQKGIFQAPINTPQYWVIDAIDEGNKYQEFFTMIKGLRIHFPLRIFITSRKISDMPILEHSLKISAQLILKEMAPDSVMGDIERYINDRIESLPRGGIRDNGDLGKILHHRANACFLWARLVLDELETVYSDEGILDVLETIPADMVPYYERTIQTMAENKREKHIAQGVLHWVVASVRDLTISELSQALEIDTGSKLASARTAVEGLCGQLVTVADRSEMVQLVHPTVREFLLSEAAGDFIVHKAESNKRIALTCLKLLSSDSLQPPRNRRQLARRAQRTNTPLLQYASAHFSEHVYISSTKEDEILIALAQFLNTNILSWIEVIAQGGDLHPLIRVSKNLKAYLARRAKYKSPLSAQVRLVERWAIDLSFIATKFSKVLLQTPSSIYYLIPPLCPTSSAISQQVANKIDGLSIIGFRDLAWDDCTAAVSFDVGNFAASITSGENLIAVGMESGNVSLYNIRTFQKEGMFYQKHPIDLVYFADNRVTICTTRTVAMFDREGSLLWETRTRSRSILLTSTSAAVIAVSQHGHMIQWDIHTGELLEDQAFEYASPDEDITNAPRFPAPESAAFSPDMELLALGYRWGTVCLWEIPTNEVIRSVRDSDTNSAPVLHFNPKPGVDLLLAVYKQRELVLYETSCGTMVHRQKISSVATITSVTCSPDGRTLATVDTFGTFQVWDFESLMLLYQVSTSGAAIRTLQFSTDGSSVVDMTRSVMRNWSPAILVRRNIEEDQSVSDDTPDLPAIEGNFQTGASSRFTAIANHPSLPLLFIGKPDGEVALFDSKSGSEIRPLYSHADNSCINGLLFCSPSIIASRDANSIIQVRKLTETPDSGMQASPAFFKTHSKAPIRQMCFNSDATYLMVTTDKSDIVYSIQDQSQVGARNLEAESTTTIRKWFPIPGTIVSSPDQFGLLDGQELRLFGVSDFPSTPKSKCFSLDYTFLPDEKKFRDIAAAVVCQEANALVVEFRHTAGFVQLSRTIIFNMERLASTAGPLAPLSERFTQLCKHFIGFIPKTKTFIFLGNDSWLCSVDLLGLKRGDYARHIFVPDDFVPPTADLMPILTSDNSFAVCLNGRLTVIKNALNFRETRKMPS